MSHFPVNHPLRPLYRVLAALCGAYTLLFGIVGFTQTRDHGLFAQTDLPWVLGLRTNLAFALLSIVSGAVLIVSAVIGRNLDYAVNVAGGLLFMLIGMLMLGLMRTDANFLGFSMVNCIVSFVIGTVVFTAGLYGRTGPADAPAHA
jgi:predicted membrane-bound spermidine synthase